jgi:hypothetical protein
MVMVNLGLRFLLELASLGALGYWGFTLPLGLLSRLLLGLGAPLAAALLWGTFVSPKAAIPLPGEWRLVPEALVFGAATAALYFAGKKGLAGSFLVLVVLNRILMLVLPE